MQPKPKKRHAARRAPTTDKVIADYRDTVADAEDVIRRLGRTSQERWQWAASNDQKSSVMETQCRREHFTARPFAPPQ